MKRSELVLILGGAAPAAGCAPSQEVERSTPPSVSAASAAPTRALEDPWAATNAMLAKRARATRTDQGVDPVHTIDRDPTNHYGARLASAGTTR